MEDSRRDLDTDRGEETANSRTTTIRSIFALKKEALDFTNQPLPGLSNGLLEEKLSLPANPLKTPDPATQPMHSPTFPSPEASVYAPEPGPVALTLFALSCPFALDLLFKELRCSPSPHGEFPLFPWRCWDPWSLLVFFSNQGRWLCLLPSLKKKKV